MYSNYNCFQGTPVDALPRLTASTLPPVSPSPFHTVCFDPNTMSPDPAVFDDHWDHDHVKLACSKQNVYPTVSTE